MWWIIPVLISHHIEDKEGKVITVNSNGASDSDCCVEGRCTCSSLSIALSNIENSTIINITSQSVELDNYTVIGAHRNITITSDMAVIKCNNKGSVSFINTTNVTIRGITWDQCGNPNNSHIDGGIYFEGVTNLTIDNCTFQHSHSCAVVLSAVSDDVTIKNSYFMFNGLRKTAGEGEGDCGGLKINSAALEETTVVISNSVFSGNGKLIDKLYYPIYGLFIDMSDSSQGNLTLIINKTDFVSNFGGMYIKAEIATFSIFICEVNVVDSIDAGINLPRLQTAKGYIYFLVLNSRFNNNGNGGLVSYIFASNPYSKVNIMVKGTNFTDNRAVNFSNGALAMAISPGDTAFVSVNVLHSSFINNSNGTIYISTSQGKVLHEVNFYEVVIKESVTMGSYSGSGAVSISLLSSYSNIYNFQSVFFIANYYPGIAGGTLFLKTANAESDIFINSCVFQNNSGLGQGSAIYVADGVTSNANVYQTFIKFRGTTFIDNTAGRSIVYVRGGTINNTKITVKNTYFINNIGTALHLFMSTLIFFTNVTYENNIANKGAALYLEQGTQVYFYECSAQFVNNKANQYGGAIYIDLPSTCPNNVAMFHSQTCNLSMSILFKKNVAGVTGNSIYFNTDKFCAIDTNLSSINSLFPSLFSEAHNKSIATSPHSVVLYFPSQDGSYIGKDKIGNDKYFITNKILGKTITSTGEVIDFFNNSAEPKQFHVKCLHGYTNYILANNHDRLLFDNVSLLNITLSGSRIDNPVNITLLLTLIPASSNKQITLQLIIQLSPCYPGYFHNVHSNTCVCYHHQDIVKCYDDYNEIKRGYWFGFITGSSKPTVSLCPSRYCYFEKHRKETRQEYYLLPSTSDNQCHSHRTGVACGECKPGYTLAYDSPDCINTDKCSAGMTVLVIVLTILCRIAIVFVLVHFSYKLQISSGYAYGIIYYYYSIVDILSHNNPSYVSEVTAVLSSFMKLTPQLFGQPCLVEGLSGIDQRFIHYSHALTVSLILLIIGLAARYSSKIAFYVCRYILRVICILLHLSYTSLVSTSFQLLRTTHYPGYDGLYVYVSPDMKYFNNRHAFYAVVALLCELIVGIGLPLFLLLEPLILSRWFNFVRVMPLLDQFQSCYKDNYRWFAANYLICRQVIIVIVYFGNNDYYEMCYLQIACVVIAILHVCIRPYKSSFLNAFDGVVLSTIILVVNLNTFTFLLSAILVIIVLCVASSKMILHYTRSQDQQQCNLIDFTDHVHIADDTDNKKIYERYVYCNWYIL